MADQDHNLRDTIAKAVGDMLGFGDEPEIANVVLAVLSSHPEAVLSLLGTVVEARADFCDQDDRWYVAIDVGRESFPLDPQPVFVVSLAETAKD